MRLFMQQFRRFNLHIWAIIIAVALWLQVHGQGEGSLNMDIPLQIQGLPAGMVIVNDLPDHVRVTVTGLQTRLKDLHQQDMSLPLQISDITTPGVVERALQVAAVSLPVGLHIEKVQPDRLELQVDRLVTRSIPVKAHFELPEGWKAAKVTVEPKQVHLIGPEVWLDTLRQVETTPIRPVLKAGTFRAISGVESPSGKAIRLVENNVRIEVRGVLVQTDAPVIPDGLGGGEQQ
ncbi:YbbR-like protein [Mariprofundus micogutta]|uniref:YbbR-like protein n=1 Tax=Mariprofundus micogutta TaxID=1921010 RepID=A0A1L8CM20_9PROT|nr:CdaR family protein [Mariprofundus micogutta]GAV19951.1 YbbR-like protein [Mariprofundus micogutta]